MVFLIANSGVSPLESEALTRRREYFLVLWKRVDILAGHRFVKERTPKGQQGAEQTVLRV